MKSKRMGKRFPIVVGLLAIAALVTLACGAEPTPTPQPGPVSVSIGPDGNGDYGSLTEAVKAVPAGSTITLAPGTYRLEEPLDVDRPLLLVGNSLDDTFVLSDAPGYVVRYTGGDGAAATGTFAATEITFGHEGQAAADVVIVEGGQFSFTHCRFTGAFRADTEEERAGLRLQGNAIGVVEDSEARANGSIGIWVMDQAQPRLADNTLTGNTLYGLLYTGSARGTASKNAITGSQGAGIQVADQAAPTLEGNVSMGNGTGLAYVDSAGGTARGNDCSANLAAGITVGNEARPELEGSICNGNVYGIVYAGSEGGIARGNEASGNEVGLLIGESAHPVLEDNRIHDNEVEDIRDLRP